MPSKNPYSLIKNDDGSITIDLDCTQWNTHSDFEGYEKITTTNLTQNSKNAIITQVTSSLNQNPFARFKQEIRQPKTASFTTQLVGFLALWSIFQLFIFPYLFGVSFESELWQSTFVLSSENISNTLTWITNIVSHGGLLHLLVNSIVIISFGYFIEDEMSSLRFAALFFGSALIAGLTQVSIVSIFGSEPMQILGASGGAATLLGCMSVFHPKTKIALFFIFPIDIWKGIALFLTASTSIIIIFGFGAGNLAHLAHIIGVTIGISYGLYHKKYHGLTENF